MADCRRKAAASSAGGAGEEAPAGGWATWTRAGGEERPFSGWLRGGLYPFCVPGVTNHHELSVYKQRKFINLQFYRLKIQHRSHKAKIKVLAGLRSFPEALGENPFPCLFQLPEAALQDLQVTPYITEPATGCGIRLSPFSLILTTAGNVFPFKDSRGDTGPIRIIQDNLSISRSLTLITPAENLMPCKATYSQVPGD